MIQKTISLSLPWDDSKVIALERMLSTLFTQSLQIRAGTYTGDGTSSKAVTFGIKALFVYIMRKSYGAYNGVFAIREADKYTYIPTAGIVNNAVTGFTVDGVTLGAHIEVNQASINYAYIAIG